MRVVLRTTNRTFTYDCDSSEIPNLAHYDDTIYLDCSNGKMTSLPTTLPPRLQILKCSHNSLSTFPPFPDTLRTLYASCNKIQIFPLVQDSEQLEILDLQENSIYSVKNVTLPPNLKELNLKSNVVTEFSVKTWPDQLVELNLSGNHLTELSPTFDDLVQSCSVNVEYNDFPSQKYNAYTLWINSNNMNDVSQIVSRHTRFGISVKTRWETQMHAPVNRPVVPVANNLANNANPLAPDVQAVMNQLLNLDTRPVVRSVYQDAHNVHASSIQNSTNESLKWLIDSGPIEKNAIHSMRVLWRPSHWWNIIEWMDVLHANTLLDTWCIDPTIHSVHGISYGQLIGYMWNVVKTNENKREIAKVLRTEILDADGVCFTGRFTRTLNALSGFVAEVVVGISSREQMQNRIVAVIDKTREKHGDGSPEYENEAKEGVVAILKEFSIPEEEHSAWIDAI